jgi:hypothetical protein
VDKLGLNVCSYVLNLLIFNGMGYKDAERLSQQLDHRMREAAWLTTFDGTTFERTYTPHRDAVCERISQVLMADKEG